MMKKRSYLLHVFLLCMLVSNVSRGQSTGSYDTVMSFSGGARAVSFYVPPTYNAAIKYRLMVCLHGLGDTCNNYRDALVIPLAWPASMPNTIFICTEAAYRNGDYYYPAGGEAVIQAAMDFAMSLYHIDTANVVLQGFSLGGQSALRYGLDNYAKFKGMLLNTPAMQGVKAALNQTSSYSYTYANASHIPIYITHGMDDILYTAPIDSTYEQLVLNDGKVRYYEFAGLGHSIPPTASIANCLSFFDTPTVAGRDMDVVRLQIDQRSCVPTLPATCLLRNTGDATIHTAILNYTFAGSTLTYTWTGSLGPFQHTIVSLPGITAPAGSHTLNVSVGTVDGAADTYTANNSLSAPFQVVLSGTPLPVFEGFEGVFPPVNWIQYLAGDAYSPWYADSTVMKTGIASMGTFNTIFIFDNSGRKEDIASPVLDLTTGTHAHLTFDVSYNYHHYTPPYTLMDTVFADTLAILVSVDGGNTYTQVYKKGGSQLATFASPILNPLSIDADFIVPTASDWRTDSVDLSAFDTASKAIVKFSYLSALGGSINIDNIKFANTPLGIHDPGIADLQVYPNPATEVVNVSAQDDFTDVRMTDVAGRVVYCYNNANGSKMITIPVASLTEGIYMLNISNGNGSSTTRKITIGK